MVVSRRLCVLDRRHRRSLRPLLFGAAAYAGLFVYALAAHGRFSIMGVRDERMARIVDILEQNFIGRAVADIGLIFLAYALLGAAFALFFSLWSRRAAIYLPLLAAFHSLVFVRAMIRWPQLFAEFWQQPGGWRATFMMRLTDAVPPVAPGVAIGLLLAATAVRGLFYLPARRRLAALGVAVAMAAVPFVPRTPAAAANHGPNLLILAADSLRADRLGAYGCTRDTTPAIDRLAQRATVFERAYVPLPRTFQSWATLLTGKWPPTHGIRSMFPTFEQRARLGRTMMHDLADAGWRTAVVSDFAGDIFPRADFGFQETRAPGFTILTLAELRLLEIQEHLLPYLMNRAGRAVFPILAEFAHGADASLLGDEVLGELGRLAGRERFALAVFFSTTHFPYAAPAPYYRQYAGANYRGPYKYHKIRPLAGGETLSPADRRQVNDLFDGAVRAVDDQIGRILDWLDKTGLARNTVVVITADHGEHLYDRPDLGMDHGDHLRADYAVRVPLIVFDPRDPAARRVAARVREVDAAPTLLALLGRAPPAGIEGVDLAPWARGERADDLPLYFETGLWYADEGDEFYQQYRLHYPDVTQICDVDTALDFQVVEKSPWEEVTTGAKHRAWVEGGWKLLVMPTHDGLRRELYDLGADPAESVDVAAQRPEIADRLLARLKDFLAERPQHEPLETAILAWRP